MTFSEQDKTKALAIIHVFETGKAFGDYSACAVLDDKAGISYGASQFTHRSGSLADVLDRFQQLGGTLPQTVADNLQNFHMGRLISTCSANAPLKQALRRLGSDPVMQQAQRDIAFSRYLRPAMDACEGSSFTSALALAVIYDSENQGSFGHIRDMVTIDRSNFISDVAFEHAWIAEFCRCRHNWIATKHGDLLKSIYRPNFFLGQIKQGNWDLKLPLNVQGCHLTDAILFPSPVVSTVAPPAVEPTVSKPTVDDPPEVVSPEDPPLIELPSSKPDPEPGDDTPKPSVLERITHYQSTVDQLSSWRNSLNPFTPSLSKISGQSWVSAILGKILAIFLGVWGVIESHPEYTALGVALFLGVLAYLAIAKGHALERFKAFYSYAPGQQAQEQKVVVNNG